jgi:predicted permease
MWHVVDTVGQDVRYRFRQLRKSPGFAFIAVLTLALGIGANTAVFSVMDAVLLRSLPVRDPQQLVYLRTSDFPGGQTGYGETSMRMQVYEALRQENRVFSDLMAWVPLFTSGGVPARFGAEPEELKADMVSGNFFSGLGVPAARGRIFDLKDEQQHSQVAVLNYAYWTRRFARDSSVLGATLYIKGVPFTIVGIAQQNFQGLDSGGVTDVWVPFQVSDELRPWGVSPQSDSRLYGSRWWFLLTVGRLQPGVDQKQALAYLNPIFRRAAAEGLSPEDMSGRDKPPVLSFDDTRGMPGTREDYQQPLRILMGMVALVLAIACGNIAMLLIARNAPRQREFSLRMALGGSRTRLFRQLLAESTLLVAAGAALGWLFAIWATQALAQWSLLERSLAPDARVLWFTLAVSALVGILFGLAPLRGAVRTENNLVLKTSNATSVQDRRSQRAGRVMIPLQMAMCLVLLVGAGLLVRTLRNLQNLDLGLKTSGLLVFGLTPQQYVHNDEEGRHFFQTLVARVRTLPGVESATVTRQRLGAGWSSNTTAIVDGQKPKISGWPSMRWNAVGPDFFHVMRIPLLLGRDITETDSAEAPGVVVVNQTFANRYLPGTNAIGHVVQIERGATAKTYTIVGVAADSKYTEVREQARPMAYFPYTQIPSILSMTVELRTAGDPQAFWPEVRRAMREIAPDLAMIEPMTQEEQFSESLAGDRLFARLAMFFGALAVILVATGLYGTLAYKVVRRTPEIGVRMALGAQQGQVLWMVLRESLLLYLVGIILGMPAAMGVARLLKASLFGLEAEDPFTFAAAILGIALVALAASFVPARRASSVDPMLALRSE